MLVELLNTNNYGRYNIKLAQYFGLETAVYCQTLIDIYEKAFRKNKLINEEYFKIDRKYIFTITSISIETQLKIDSTLDKLNILFKDPENPDIIKLDLQMFISIVSSDNIKLVSDIASKVKIKNKAEEKVSKRQAIINNLKNGIVCTNYELLTALREWVDAIFANPRGFLSKKAIEVFQTTLNQYTKGDLDLALRLVQIATVQGYKDCTWAINMYEKDVKLQKSASNNALRITEQQRSTKDTLSDQIF